MCQPDERERTTWAGTPTTVAFGGTSSVTTAPAPTVAQSPMLIPGRTLHPIPNSAPSPTLTPPARWTPGATVAKLERRASWDTVAPTFTITCSPMTTSEVITAPGATTDPGPKLIRSPQVARGSTNVANGFPKRNRIRSTIRRLAAESPIATTNSPALLYVPLPLLLWAGLRFGPAGASASLTIVAFLAIFGAGNGIGALGTGSAAENASAVQMFLIFIAPTMLILAAIVDERRRAEDALRESGETSQKLSRRLLTAHEDERRRLARELHDDVTQRLARLAIDAARFEAGELHAHDGSPQSLHGELVRLSEDVHALSYRLHPSILDDLGLAEALKAECEHVSRREPVQVQVEVQEVPDGLPHDVALCIFRVAQEALRNVAGHARASVATVSLALKEGGLSLAVIDNGIGFDIDATQSRASLGRASMGERVRLLGGTFHIKSTSGQGTTVSAWVPLKVTSS